MPADPGQMDLFGGEAPPEKSNPELLRSGFRAINLHGRVLYGDPFNPGVMLTVAQARALRSGRMLQTMQGGWRVHYPEGRYVKARIGIRRSTPEGAWHELQSFTGGDPHVDAYVIDSDGLRCNVAPPETGG